MRLFFSEGHALLVCGVRAPILFGNLIGTGKAINVFYGDLIGAALMTLAGIIAIFFAVSAERKGLEMVAALSPQLRCRHRRAKQATEPL